jgi:MFS transporter, NNP family, nitrate/nitrite transporter
MEKAVRIQLADFKTAPMRAFHMSWMAFFLCFFGWFGIAPMLSIVREDLGLTTDQIVTSNILAVSTTIFMRLLIGRLCDTLGPRIAYTWLLILGSLPVMCIGLADSYATFLIGRMCIGMIGASFVITQAHTSLMFAPNCVGTANATSAGWGNLGGGVTQQVMPFIFAACVALVGEKALGWRLAMIAPGILLMITGFLYYFLTQDTPNGNFKELRAKGMLERRSGGSFLKVCLDYRVWILFLVYGGCFGVELIVNSNAALYFTDYFNMDVKMAGLIAGLFGLMNLFARTLGGVLGDKFGIRGGLKGRVRWLFVILFVEGIAMIIFSRMSSIPMIILTIMTFSLAVQMSEGATFSLVPFIDKKNIGMVSGIVGAGGNAGAMAGMFLFKSGSGLTWPDAFMTLGCIVLGISFLALGIRFSQAAEHETRTEIDVALQRKRALQSV